MTKFVVYKRLSKQKQEGNQYGFDSQQVDMENFLKTQNEPQVIAEFGEFFTGKGDWQKRSELVKAVNLCKLTGASLLVSKVDRLGRNVASVARLLEIVDVKIATMPSATNMVVQILSSVAEEEARAISLRIKSALAVAKSKGILLGAAAHKESNKSREEKRQYKEAKGIAENFEDSLRIMRSSGFTYDKMADKLNEQGKTTARGCSFSRKTVQRMCEKLGMC